MFDTSSDDLAFELDLPAGTLRVAGGLFTDLDARRLEREINQATTLVEGGTLVVDLAGVTFLPSTALQSLVAARRTAKVKGVAVALAATPGTLPHRVLTAVGFPLQQSAVEPGSRESQEPPPSAS
ncbi:STAS domain-containing protein [Nocardioides zeae]|uniref:STAS domain-containing protein n=1 Tax=Nocardioides imazamoxiresistens TaxID=3231893 RepID=A0ABU3PRX5_9ACTN|nr:STAS domain-containing protein [Nocardioides zeae]MDT9591964.1 STAS domain-containing protein [Nocardioides zeae]